MDKNNAIEKWSTLNEIQEHLGVAWEAFLNWISTRNMPAYKFRRL